MSNGPQLIGNSEAIRNIQTLIKQVAPTDISVLITGESGSGKEVAAELIHHYSRRASQPLITVNCGAIPEGIFESEVFGHEKGSFTGADRQRRGYFELADNGTIFLDEIGEMPLNSQVKILRILENGTFMRVGGTAEIQVDVRVIAATNRDIAGEVASGQFRSDLYYRLKAVNIWLPPLRERREDIPLLAEYFIEDFCRRNHIPKPQITPDAMELLSERKWEGNVRELKNFIESLVTLERSGIFTRDSILRLAGGNSAPSQDAGISLNLPVFARRTPEQMERELLYRTLMDLRREIWELKQMVADLPGQKDYGVEIRSQSLEDMEREQIKSALQQFNGNRRLAAESLGIGERTLYRKIREWGL